MTSKKGQDAVRARAAELAREHGISEEQAYRLLADHPDDDGFEEALRNLAHFLRAPS